MYILQKFIVECFATSRWLSVSINQIMITCINASVLEVAETLKGRFVFPVKVKLAVVFSTLTRKLISLIVFIISFYQLKINLNEEHDVVLTF